MIEFKKNLNIKLCETLSGHWYKVGSKYYPSATTILTAYPMSEHLIKWTAEQGWDEAQKIKSDAGLRGSRIHDAIEHLISGTELIRDGFAINSTSSYSLNEWAMISQFVEWYKEVNPEVLGTEVMLFSKKHGFAGKTDLICKINGLLTIVDYKSSAYAQPYFPLQFGAYAAALEEMTDLKVEQTAMLQLGYKYKGVYKRRFVVYPEWQKDFQAFLKVRDVWRFDNEVDKDFVPPILDLPDTLKL